MKIVNDPVMKEYNKKYFNKDTETDVISFPLQEKLNNRMYLGDIIISYDQAVSYAENKDIIKQLLFLIAHGIYHLIGFNDSTESDRKRMIRKQNLVLKSIFNDT